MNVSAALHKETKITIQAKAINMYFNSMVGSLSTASGMFTEINMVKKEKTDVFIQKYAVFLAGSASIL